MEEKAFGLKISIITRAINIMEGRKEGKKEGIIGRNITAQVRQRRCD